MITVIPAIDILNSKIVRLFKGKYDDVTEYRVSISQQAKIFNDIGVKRIHVVDLDGARNGTPVNIDSVEKIIKASSRSCAVEVGGGIRTLESIKRYISLGADRVILGTKAVNDFIFLEQAVSLYKEKIVVSIDVKNDKPATSGWYETKDISIVKLVKQLEIIGVKTIIYTDISKDGTLSGLDIESIKHNLAMSSMKYIVSGGVASIDDLEALAKIKDERLNGVIIGKAMYDGRIDIKEAIDICEKRNIY